MCHSEYNYKGISSVIIHLRTTLTLYLCLWFSRKVRIITLDTEQQSEWLRCKETDSNTSSIDVAVIDPSDDMMFNSRFVVKQSSNRPSERWLISSVLDLGSWNHSKKSLPS